MRHCSRCGTEGHNVTTNGLWQWHQYKFLCAACKGKLRSLFPDSPRNPGRRESDRQLAEVEQALHDAILTGTGYLKITRVDPEDVVERVHDDLGDPGDG